MNSNVRRTTRYVALPALLGLVLGCSASWAWFGSVRQVVQAGAPAQAATSGTKASLAYTAVDAASSLKTTTMIATSAVSPKVVLIQSAVGLGSDEIIDARGYVVTNDPVLLGTTIQHLVSLFTVTLPNGRTYTGSATGTYSADDLAVLVSGKIIVGIDGTAINTTVELDDAISQLQPSHQVYLSVAHWRYRRGDAYARHPAGCTGPVL
jgi:S1-C subfamily serine protease